MTANPAARPFRDAGWILVGAVLGSSVCFLVAGVATDLDMSRATSFASLAVCALMFSSLHERRHQMPAPTPC